MMSNHACMKHQLVLHENQLKLNLFGVLLSMATTTATTTSTTTTTTNVNSTDHHHHHHRWIQQYGKWVWHLWFFRRLVRLDEHDSNARTQQREASSLTRTEEHEDENRRDAGAGISFKSQQRTKIVPENRRLDDNHMIAPTIFAVEAEPEGGDEQETTECKERWIKQKTSIMLDPASTIEQELVYRAKAEDEARMTLEQEVVTKPPPDFRNFLRKLKEDRELRKRNGCVPIPTFLPETERGDEAKEALPSHINVEQQHQILNSSNSVPPTDSVDPKLIEQARALRQSLLQASHDSFIKPTLNVEVQRGGRQQLIAVGALTQPSQKQGLHLRSVSAPNLAIMNQETSDATRATTRNPNKSRKLSNFIESLIHSVDHEEEERKRTPDELLFSTRGSMNSQASQLARSESELCIFEDSCHTIPSIPLPQAVAAPTNSSVAQRCGSAAWVAYQIESQMVDEQLYQF